MPRKKGTRRNLYTTWPICKQYLHNFENVNCLNFWPF